MGNRYVACGIYSTYLKVRRWGILALAIITLLGCDSSIQGLFGRGPANTQQKTVYLPLTNLTISEGSAALIQVAVDQIYTTDTVVTVTLSGGSAGRFDPIAATLTILANNLTASLVLQTVDDTVFQGTENFVLSIGSNDSEVSVTTPNLNIQLNDNDSAPTISVLAASVNEGETLNFVVSLSNATLQPVVFSWQTLDGTATVANSDYAAASGTVTIAALSLTAGLAVVTVSDTTAESDETMRVTLSAVTNATVTTPGTHDMATGTIANDDILPVLSVVDVSVTEGGTAFVVATLSALTGNNVVFNWRTFDGTAVGTDYTAVGSTTFTIAAGQLSISLPVVTTSDVAVEGSENFSVSLSALSNADPGALLASVTILDDDGAVPDPISLTGTFTSVTSVSLSWASGGGSTVDYTISYMAGSTAPADCSLGTKISYFFISGTSHNITGLTSGTTYSFRVCAIDGSVPVNTSPGSTVTVTTLTQFNVVSSVPATNADSNIGDGICADSGGKCSLRAAFQEVNANSANPFLLYLEAGTYTLNTISTVNFSYLKMVGVNSSNTIIEGNTTQQFLETTAFMPEFVAEKIQFRQFASSSFEPAILNNTGGRVDQTYKNCSFVNNHDGNISGIISTKNGGDLLIESSSFTGNTGHITLYVYMGTSLIKTTTFSGNNSGTASGSSIRCRMAYLTLEDTLITGGSGDGIYAYNCLELELKNSTISQNADTGLEISAGGYDFSGELYNTSFYNNGAASKGNITISASQNVTLNAYNSIFAINNTKANCAPSSGSIVMNFSHSLFDETSCGAGGTNIIGDPLLGALANNGGPTQTLMPQLNSPALDAGNNATCLSTDQRGELRPVDRGGGSICDIGAVEAGAPAYLEIADATIAEGSTGYFMITLSEASELPVVATWQTLDSTATSGADYASVATGTLTIPAGSLMAYGSLTTLQDVTSEASEYFIVSLSGVNGATLIDGIAMVRIADDDVPPEVTGLTATAVSAGRIDLSWTSGGGSTNGYRISYQAGFVAPVNCSTGTQISEGSIVGTSHSITGLPNDTQYAFRVCAIDSNAPIGVSDGVAISVDTNKVAPPDPSNLNIVVHSSSAVTLSWTAAGGTTTGYRIAYQTGGTAPATCALGTVLNEYVINGTSRYLTGLTAATNYSFRLCSVNDNVTPDMSAGITGSATTMGTPPPNPTALVLTSVSNTQINLSWTTGGGTTADFEIAYLEGYTPPATCHHGTKIPAASVTGTSHSVTGLNPLSFYAFRVCALTAGNSPSTGLSGYSQTRGTPSLALIPIPGTPLVTDITYYSAKLNFTLQGSGKYDSFMIRVNSGGTAPANCATSGSVVNVTTNAYEFSPGKYEFEMDSPFTAYFQPNTTYSGIVCSSWGGSTPTYSTPLAFTFTTVAVVVPTEPTITIIPTDQNSVFHDCDATDYNNTGHIALAYQVGGTPPVKCTTSTLECGGGLGAPFPPGSVVTFRACAAGHEDVASSYSDGVLATITMPSLAVPPDPVSLTANATSYKSIALAWQSGGGSTVSYRVAYQQGATAPADCAAPQASDIYIAPVYAANNLNSGTTYSFRVCAENYDVPIEYSGGITISATTSVGPVTPPDPSGFVVTPLSHNTMRFTWIPSAGTTVGYRIAYNSDGTTPINCTSATGGNLNISGQSSMILTSAVFAAGTNYGFRICSYNADMPVEYSAGVTGTASTSTSPPLNPINLKATGASISSIRLTWAAGDVATIDYRIAYKEGTTVPVDCLSDTIIDYDQVSGSSHVVTGLKAGTRYSFRVCALSSGTPPASSSGVTTVGYSQLANGLEVIHMSNYSYSGSLGAAQDVSWLGDTDGDGKQDIASAGGQAADIYDNPAGGSGLVRHLSAGQAISWYGDYNHDGYDDILIGAADYSGLNMLGSVAIYSGLDGSVLFSREGPESDDGFGSKVFNVGDYDADGVDDILVSAPAAGTSTSFAVGAAFVVSAANGQILETIKGTTAEERVGSGIAALGDINADGVPDFAVGSSGFDGAAGTDCGRVQVISGINGSDLMVIEGEQAGSLFGKEVSLVNDINGDGKVDFGVGATMFDGVAGTDSGKVYIFSGLNGSIIHAIEGEQVNSEFGAAISAAGDFDHAGTNDFAIGAPNFDSGWGKMYLYSGVDASVIVAAKGVSVYARFASVIKPAGDYDGDGRLDLITVGGSIYVIRGQNHTPLP